MENKMVYLSEEELRILCEEAVDRAVEKYICNEKERDRRRQSSMLHNTKLLLENYRKLKAYLEKAESKLENIIDDAYPDDSVELVEVFGLKVNDQRSYTIA